MTTENTSGQDRTEPTDTGDPGTPPAAVMPNASGQAAGAPVGIVAGVNDEQRQGGDRPDVDPAEAEFERLTGHSTNDARPPHGDASTDR